MWLWVIHTEKMEEFLNDFLSDEALFVSGFTCYQQIQIHETTKEATLDCLHDVITHYHWTTFPSHNNSRLSWSSQCDRKQKLGELTQMLHNNPYLYTVSQY